MTKEQLGSLIIVSEDTMYHVAKTLLYSDADCADAIQEAIVKAFSKVNTLKKDEFAKTWLIRILMNECYAVLRKNRHTSPMEDVLEKGSPACSVREDYSELYEALSRLPEEMRLTVTMYYLEGYRVREIAALMETTESTVKNRLARARGKLRQDLEEMGAAGV